MMSLIRYRSSPLLPAFALCLHAGNCISAYEVTDYFPMAVGYEWLYESDEGSEITTGVVRVDYVDGSISPTEYRHTYLGFDADHLNGDIQEYKSNGDGMRYHSFNVILDGLPDYKMDYNGGLPLLPARFEVGESVTFSRPVDIRFDLSGEPDLNWSGILSGSFRVVGTERVHVPAGEFDALRFQGRWEYDARLDAEDYGRYDVPGVISGGETHTIWAAAGVGIVKQNQSIRLLSSEELSHVMTLLEIPDFVLPPRAWYSEAAALSDGWRQYDWFKGFKPEGPNWIYHGRHGWLYVKADDTSRMFLWDGALGRWMFTNENVYPWMYAYGPDEGWVFFFEGGRPGSRFFKRGGSGQIVSEQQLSAD